LGGVYDREGERGMQGNDLVMLRSFPYALGDSFRAECVSTAHLPQVQSPATTDGTNYPYASCI